jgi:hypothetical protein
VQYWLRRAQLVTYLSTFIVILAAWPDPRNETASSPRSFVSYESCHDAVFAFCFFGMPLKCHTAPAVCIGTCNCALLLLAAPLEFWRPKTAPIITRGCLMRDEVSFPRV